MTTLILFGLLCLGLAFFGIQIQLSMQSKRLDAHIDRIRDLTKRLQVVEHIVIRNPEEVQWVTLEYTDGHSVSFGSKHGDPETP